MRRCAPSVIVYSGCIIKKYLILSLLLALPAFADDGFTREGKREFKDTLEQKPAPALQVSGWMNTADGNPIDLKALQGQVVLLDFWGVW